MRFRYTSRDGERTARLVEPHRLVSLGRRWYLVGWDMERHDWRILRVDRLTDPVPTGARFRQRELPAADAAEFVRQQLASIPTKYQVEVQVEAPTVEVERVVEHWGTVEPVDNTSCTLRMNVDELEWPAMVLGAIGADFEVVEPAELNDHIRSVGELFLRGSQR